MVVWTLRVVNFLGPASRHVLDAEGCAKHPDITLCLVRQPLHVSEIVGFSGLYRSKTPIWLPLKDLLQRSPTSRTVSMLSAACCVTDLHRMRN